MALKITSLLLFLFSIFLCPAQKKSVNLKITYTEPYCGGARPAKEITEEAQRARPYSKKIIVVVSETGKINSVKTNALGLIKLKLKPGKYRLYESWRYYKQVPYKLSAKDMDMECLKMEWQKEIFSINVSSEKADVVPGNEIVVYCPWAVPCLLDSARPALPQ